MNNTNFVISGPTDPKLSEYQISIVELPEHNADMKNYAATKRLCGLVEDCTAVQWDVFRVDYVDAHPDSDELRYGDLVLWHGDRVTATEWTDIDHVLQDQRSGIFSQAMESEEDYLCLTNFNKVYAQYPEGPKYMMIFAHKEESAKDANEVDITCISAKVMDLAQLMKWIDIDFIIYYPWAGNFMDNSQKIREYLQNLNKINGAASPTSEFE